MHVFRSLSERPFDALLREAADARADGLVVLRDRAGARHGVWLRAGYVVGVHVAGRFDPLLEILRRRGALDARAQRACVARLGERRAGALASALFGVRPAEVRDALRAQLVGRLAALLQIAGSEGYDAALEPGAVPEGEASLCMPLGALMRRVPGAAPRTPEDARRELRRLAKALHPDRHGRLDPAVQRALARQLAEATAAYHGFH